MKKERKINSKPESRAEKIIYEFITSKEFVTQEDIKEHIKDKRIAFNYCKVMTHLLETKNLIKKSYSGSKLVIYQDIKNKEINDRLYNKLFREHMESRKHKLYNKISTKHDNFHITDIESDNALLGYENMLTYLLKILKDAGKVDEAKELSKTKAYQMWADCQNMVHPTRITNTL